MKLVIIFGPQAVGKMTVGQELEKVTNLKLFHNHMTIELVAPFFSYGTETGKRLVNLFRKEIFTAVAESDQEGLIFTFVWAFDQPDDWDYIKELTDLFESNGGEVYLVELEADVTERKKRNVHEHRLREKPTKRDVDRSQKELEESVVKHRLNSNEGEIPSGNYIKINNTDLLPSETAERIKIRFRL